MSLSRRAFLKGLSAAAGLAVLPMPLPLAAEHVYGVNADIIFMKSRQVGRGGALTYEMLMEAAGALKPYGLVDATI